MTTSPISRRPSALTLALAGLLLLFLVAGTAEPALCAARMQNSGAGQVQPQPLPRLNPPPPLSEMNPAALTPKQERAILKANYEKMKTEADELAALAKSLQNDLSKSNQDILSLQVAEKADKIEKLAKKIRQGVIR